MATVTELPGGTSTDTLPASRDAMKETGDNWRLVEAQPIREDQVENAVKFLSHPKVKGSPVLYRRSFLERKGLSREEIDEAFRRVPDPPSDSSSSTVPGAGPEGTANSPVQGAKLAKPGAQVNNVQVAPKSSSWAQILLALGVLTAAGAGAGVLTKKFFIPKLKEWIVEIASGKISHGEPSKASPPNNGQEAAATAAAAAAAAATAATQVVAAMQEIAKSNSEDRKSLDSIIRAVEAQTQELKSTLAGMKDIVQNVEVMKYQRPVTSNGGGIEDYQKGQMKAGRATTLSESHSIYSKQTNFGSAQESSARIYNNGQQVKPTSSSPPNGAVHAPHSQSYLDVMAMLERGEKPPGIRDVNDKPPNPNQQPSIPRLQPRLKPWEKAALESQSSIPGAGVETSQPERHNESWVGNSPAVNTELTIGSGTSSSSEPWWRTKGDTNAVLSSSSVKITEVETVTEADIGTVQVGQSSSSSFSAQSGGGRAGWVPPAVPLPVYPGAEEAIRRPKPPAGGTPVQTPSPAENVPGASSSSSVQSDESPVQAEVLATFTQSNSEIPEQRVEGPDEQEYLDESLVDSTRTFKDVVQEEGDQQ